MSSAKKIVVGLSGGRDSAGTAAKLVRGGWDVTGVFLRLSTDEYITSQHEKDAAAVANFLGIPFLVHDATSRFEEIVLQNFTKEYLHARTPNPCIRCNPSVKFESLLEVAGKNGAGHIATGHYVRPCKYEKTGRWTLRRGADFKKDQSYFLSSLKQRHISKFIAPLGELTYIEVLKLAEEWNLPVSEKPSSQEICFVSGHYKEFLNSRPEVKPYVKPGDIVDMQGRALGKHKGLPFYTIGQRSGLGIAHEHPLYVIKIEPEKNRLVVGSKEETYSKSLIAINPNFMAIAEIASPMTCRAQIRYRHKAAEAMLEPLSDKEGFKVTFKKSQQSITPGQTVVIYERNLILASGTIQ